jgi:hypothetical protein
MISERLLHFIWQHQYFNKQALTTIEGERLEIHFPGTLNHNQGPDFTKGKIRVADTVLVGNIEIHINASDWIQHKHLEDPNYDNIILHVVWNADRSIEVKNPFPTLELNSLVPKILLQRYIYLNETEQFVPCQQFLPSLSKLAWTSWKERLCVERLEIISKNILEQLSNTRQHWEEVFWWRLSRNFGTKLNADLFEAMANTIPLTVMAKHKNQLVQLEALLFGQSNLLPKNPIDEYSVLLKQEFEHLKKMHRLKPVSLQPVFLRMRPASFPTVRITQMAALLFDSVHLFSKVLAADSINELKKLLQVTASEYWNHHYVFGEVSAFQPKKLGFEMSNNILINTIVPIVFTYGLYNRQQKHKDKAIEWLMQLTAEQNQFTRKWVLYNVHNNNAFDSQALLHLKSTYCDNRKCLDCAVGNQLMAAAAAPAQVN